MVSAKKKPRKKETKRVKKLDKKRLVLIISIVLASLLLIQCIICWINFASPNSIVGLKIQNQAIGRQDSAQLTKEVNEDVTKISNKKFSIGANGIYKDVDTKQIGVTCSVPQNVKQILAVGKAGNVFQNIADQDRALVGLLQHKITCSATDQKLANVFLDQISTKANKPYVNATFALDNKNNLMIRSESDGKSIDKKASLNSVNKINFLNINKIDLPTNDTKPEINVIDLKPLVSSEALFVKTPFIINVANTDYTISQEQLLGLYHPEKQSNKVVLAYDDKNAEAIIDGILHKIAKTATDEVILDGKVVTQGNSGQTFDISQAMASLKSMLLKRLDQKQNSPASTLKLSTIAIAPSVMKENSPVIHFTFDDGPTPVTSQVLDVLKKYNIKATFFVIGKCVDHYPSIAARIVNEGHVIANHTDDHVDLRSLSAQGVDDELSSAQNAIYAATGVYPTLFRPPYSSINSSVRDEASKLGLTAEMWDIDSADWTEPGVDSIVRRVVSRARPNAIIIMHSIQPETVQALPAMISELQSKGYHIEP